MGTNSAAASSLSRRRFLRGHADAGQPSPRPPWTDAKRFFDQCTRCGDCLRACPERVLVLGDGSFPAFDPSAGSGHCTFCGRCAESCTVDVFDLTRDPPWTISARIGDGCLAWKGVHCESCRDTCEPNAISMRLRIGAPPSPEIDDDACTGCGACVGVCPVGALSLIDAEGAAAA